MPILLGVFSPFDLETVEVRYHDKSFGKALPHSVSRHAHPKARPETVEPEPAAATGIDYLALTAAAHHEQLRRDERIGYHALYGQDEIPGQLSIDDFDGLDPEGEVSAWVFNDCNHIGDSPGCRSAVT